jgi:hypothetical protein
MEITLWNALLTVVIGAVSWVLKDKAAELQRVTILLNKTREELPRDYVTKAEVHADMNRVIFRLEALDAKLDRLMEAKFVLRNP